MSTAPEQRSDSAGAVSTRVHRWGPVCRGYQVVFSDGRRGSVEDIRLDDDGVELVVATGLFVRREVMIGEGEIEAILPAACRIVVRGSDGASTANGGGDLEAAGGIVRMPVLDSLRPGAAQDDAGS